RSAPPVGPFVPRLCRCRPRGRGGPPAPGRQLAHGPFGLLGQNHHSPLERPCPMKVSVVMPVYNKAPFLREAVDSILCGTFTDLELICADDKSTDGSLETLRSIGDPRLRILELPENLVPAGAVNAAMDAAT